MKDPTGTIGGTIFIVFLAWLFWSTNTGGINGAVVATVIGEAMQKGGWIVMLIAAYVIVQAVRPKGSKNRPPEADRSDYNERGRGRR